ncbi:MAG: hypothetical protein AAGG07_08245 [Planctomycetota bacterium]
MNTLRRLIAGATAAAVMLLAVPGAADAADRITLADGSVLEGEIVRELDGYLWVKVKLGGLEKQRLLEPSDYTEIERDAEASVNNDADGSREKAEAVPSQTPEQGTKPAKREFAEGTPRGAIISLGDGDDQEMVGIYINRPILERLIPILEEEEIDIVVFRINSGGGLLYSVERNSEIIHNEYKPRFRVVSWIESAISAAAMSAHAIEEHYFMPEGNYGAATGWYGQGTEIKGGSLEEALYSMEKISARGGHDFRIARSMQITEPLSADVDIYGNVTWRQDEDGSIMVNPAGRILTFNSQTAEQTGFSKGTAGTLDELTQAMGLVEVDWVGYIDPTIPYPVSKAEAEMRKFRDDTLRDEQRFNQYMGLYQESLNRARGTTDRNIRNRFCRRAETELGKIERTIRNNPNFGLLNLNIVGQEAIRQWVRDQREMIDEIRRG